MFENSLYKLARALQHENELRGRFGEYISAGHISLEARTEADDMQFMEAVVKEAPPKHLSLVIGDVVHCLRCSLDHLTSELMRAKGVTGRITFPMHETQANLEDMLSKYPLSKEFPEIVPIILNEIRPFNEGKCGIWDVGHFDNIDKHNLIIPTVSISRILNASFHTAHMTVLYTTIEIGPSNRALGYQSQSPQAFVIDDPGTPQAALLFPQGKALSGEDVIISLRQMCHLTLDAINLFGRQFDPDWSDKRIEYSEPGT